LPVRFIFVRIHDELEVEVGLKGGVVLFFVWKWTLMLTRVPAPGRLSIERIPFIA
jgi:hypothetical protein